MKKIARLVLALSLFAPSSYAADRVIDLSGGCKVYQLDQKKWVEVDAKNLDGFTLEKNQILRDEAFTVFKTTVGTFGLNQKCLRAAGTDAPPAARPAGTRRSAAPAPLRGDTHSKWSIIFGLGYNMFQSGNVKTTYNGAVSTDAAKYKGAVSFVGEGNYRFNAAFRLAVELGLSQLAVDAEHGNETSFFDTRPEFVFRSGKKMEYYVGPMLGVFFLSQNTETRAFTSGPANGTTIAVKEQTATALLLGVGAGADYALNEQFDLGFFVRYFKPGALKVTGTESFPTPGNTYEASLSTSYVTTGVRFAIHF